MFAFVILWIKLDVQVTIVMGMQTRKKLHGVEESKLMTDSIIYYCKNELDTVLYLFFENLNLQTSMLLSQTLLLQ